MNDDTSSRGLVGAVERLRAGSASREEARAAVDAWLRRTPVDERSSAAAGDDYEAAVEAAFAAARPFAKRVAREQREASRRAVEIGTRLAAEPFEHVLEALLADPMALTWSLAGELGRASFDAGFTDPGRAVALAKLGVEVAARAPRAGIDAGLAADLEASASGFLGNAYRVAGELPRAGSFLSRAETYRNQGTGDPAVTAQIQLFEASLRRELRHFPAALLASRRAGRNARKVGDTVLAARAVLIEATIHFEAAEPSRAARLLEQTLPRVDDAGDLRLSQVARHNLVLYLQAVGQLDEAEAKLQEARTFARRLGHRLDLLRLTWVEARLLATRGDAQGAERRLLETRDALLEMDVAYDAALAGLELAALYAEQGRFADVRATAEAIAPVFTSQQVHREAQAALRLFYEAAMAERAAFDLVREVGDYLERARGKPHLRFRA